MTKKSSIILISVEQQTMQCYEDDDLVSTHLISSGANGVGEKNGSECTPRGWHKVHSIIGLDNEINSVFVGRVWTKEIYTEELSKQFPGRDWILTRILRLEGLEQGKNKGGDVDTFNRYIYIHGTPDSTVLGNPASRGCIRMNNLEIIQLAQWASSQTLVYIK